MSNETQVLHERSKSIFTHCLIINAVVMFAMLTATLLANDQDKSVQLTQVEAHEHIFRMDR